MTSGYKLMLDAVLEDELYTTPELMTVAVAKLVGSRQDIPRAFKLTNQLSTSNQSDLKHLRRIKTLKNGDVLCIISKLSPNQDEFECRRELRRLEEEFADKNIFKDYHLAEVPSSAPKTDGQLKACSEIWPCKFAKCKYLNNCIQGSVFDESERLVLRLMINEALSLIRGCESGQSKSMAVVFRCAKIYGLGMTDATVVSSNPVKHSTMLAIDSVATNAGGGQWKQSQTDSTEQKFHELLQAKLDQEDVLKDHRIDAHFSPYLCTNYDIFVTEEPCVMCTMALVQSRIRRLFYFGTGDSTKSKLPPNCQPLCYPDRAIEGFLIHRDKSLNHRFEAWKVTLIDAEN